MFSNYLLFFFRSYFDPDGIEYSLCRVPTSSCDFSTRYYDYDLFENDVELNHFKLQEEDYYYKV